MKFLKTLDAAVEGFVVSTVWERRNEELLDIDAKVKFWRLTVKTMVILALPIFIVYMLFKNHEVDDWEIFLYETLQRTLSYSEWKYFEDIWNAVKDHLPSEWAGKEPLEQQKLLLSTLITLTQQGRAGGRLETEEEYLVRHTRNTKKYSVQRHGLGKADISESVPADEEDLLTLTEHYKVMYGTYITGNSFYKQVHLGIDIVFLRKPMGSRPKRKSFMSHMMLTE